MSETESTAALREKLLALTYVCPTGKYTKRCPFGALQGLSHHSRRAVLGRMDRAGLLGLFDLPPDCVCPADPRR